MTTMSRFLALIPVVAFAAGCNGTAPAGPTATSNSAVDGSGDATAMGLSRCSSLAKIELTIDNSSDSMVWVDATYHYFEPVIAQCPAPAWSSDREGLTVNKRNPFRAGFPRLAGGVAVLKAEGPNGVSARIDVDLTSISTRRIAPGVCDQVVKVSVEMVPSINATTMLQATYVYDGPVLVPCTEAPVWTADRNGLVISDRNPFQASINPFFGLTKVTASAPNGTSGSITF
jgi:hypothetical protein